MARHLADSTLERLRRKLDAEEERLQAIIAEYDKVFEQVKEGATTAEHSADPNSAEGGTLAFELQMDLSILHNAEALLQEVRAAKARIDNGTYGICEISGEPIPVERLDALPYARSLVEYADRI